MWCMRTVKKGCVMSWDVTLKSLTSQYWKHAPCCLDYFLRSIRHLNPYACTCNVEKVVRNQFILGAHLCVYMNVLEDFKIYMLIYFQTSSDCPPRVCSLTLLWIILPVQVHYTRESFIYRIFLVKTNKNHRKTSS